MAKPNYLINALNKITGVKGEIGAAWVNPGKDHITIKFNPFVVVPTGKKYAIAMFPVKPETRLTAAPEYTPPEDTSSELEDEIPF